MKGEQTNPLTASSASSLRDTEKYRFKFKGSEGIIRPEHCTESGKKAEKIENETDEQLKRTFDVCRLSQGDSTARRGSLGEL